MKKDQRPQQPREDVFEYSQMKFRLDDDKDLIALVVRTYLEDTPQQIKSLRSSLGENDLVKAKRVSHALKGSSDNSGAPCCRDAALEIEAAIDRSVAGGVVDASSSLERLRVAFEEYRKVTEPFLRELDESGGL